MRAPVGRLVLPAAVRRAAAAGAHLEVQRVRLARAARLKFARAQRRRCSGRRACRIEVAKPRLHLRGLLRSCCRFVTRQAAVLLQRALRRRHGRTPDWTCHRRIAARTQPQSLGHVRKHLSGRVAILQCGEQPCRRHHVFGRALPARQRLVLCDKLFLQRREWEAQLPVQKLAIQRKAKSTGVDSVATRRHAFSRQRPAPLQRWRAQALKAHRHEADAPAFLERRAAPAAEGASVSAAAQRGSDFLQARLHGVKRLARQCVLLCKARFRLQGEYAQAREDEAVVAAASQRRLLSCGRDGCVVLCVRARVMPLENQEAGVVGELHNRVHWERERRAKMTRVSPAQRRATCAASLRVPCSAARASDSRTCYAAGCVQLRYAESGPV